MKTKHKTFTVIILTLLIIGVFAPFVKFLEIPTVKADTYILGNDQIGGSTDGLAAGIYSCTFTTPAFGGTKSTDEIKWYGGGYSGGNYVLALYDVGGDAHPENNLANTTTGTFGSSAAWHTETISYDLSGSTQYALAVVTDASCTFYYDTGDTDQSDGRAGAYYPDPPNPWDDGNLGNWNMSIYITYSDGAAFDVTAPESTTYHSSSVSLNFSVSGVTVDIMWYNLLNDTTLVYGTNQTYTTPTTMTGLSESSNYTLLLYANDTGGTEYSDTQWFSVNYDSNHYDAQSGFADHIQTAIDAAQSDVGNGSSVYVPAGVWNFSNTDEWDTVILPAGVSLYGASNNRYDNGSNQEWNTVLCQTWDVPSNDSGHATWFQISGTGTEGYPSRISDIELRGYVSYMGQTVNSSYYLIAINIHGVWNFRVDHMNFSNCRSGVTCTSYATNGPICGVIDHCNFINTNTTVGGSGWDDNLRNVDYGVMGYGTASDTIWNNDYTNVYGYYTNRTIVVEDCVFSQWKHCYSIINGMHMIFRFNYVYEDNGKSLDAHEAYTNVPARAQEIYNNTIIDPRYLEEAQPNVYNWRGGGGLAFNNTCRDYYFMLYWRDGNYADGQPASEHSPVYYWNNVNLTGGAHYDQPPLFESNQAERGIYFYLRAPSYALDGWTYTPYQYPSPLAEEAYQTLTMESTSGGSVSPTVGEHQIETGTNQTLIATASSGYEFAAWEIDGVNETTTESTWFAYMNESHTAKAYFLGFTLTVQSTSGGSVSPTVGTHNYVNATNVTLTANPSEGYQFAAWEIDGVNETTTNNVWYVYMTDNHTAKAYFLEDVGPPPPSGYLTVALNTPPSSYVTNVWSVSFTYVPQTGYAGDFTQAYLWVNGSNVASNATAIQNATVNTIAYTFSSNGTYYWNVQVFTNELDAMAESNRTLTVSVTVYYLTMQTTSGGSISPTTGIHEYYKGTSVSATGTPEDYALLDAWELDGSNVTTTKTYAVTMNDNHTLKAYFTTYPQPITVNVGSLWTFFYEGDFIGWFYALISSVFSFLSLGVALIVMAFLTPLYIRTNSLLLICIAWLLIGSFLIVLMPEVAGLAILFIVLGVGGLVYRLFRPGQGS